MTSLKAENIEKFGRAMRLCDSSRRDVTTDESCWLQEDNRHENISAGLVKKKKKLRALKFLGNNRKWANASANGHDKLALQWGTVSCSLLLYTARTLGDQLKSSIDYKTFLLTTIRVFETSFDDGEKQKRRYLFNYKLLWLLHSYTAHVDSIKSFICPTNAHKL